MSLTLSTLALTLIAAGPGPSPAVQAVVGGRVLVMPFENHRRIARLYWLSEASSILVADELGRLGVGAIARTERRRAFERLQLPAAAALTQATMIKVGQLVGATDLVVGSYALEGDELVVRARRIRLDVGRASIETSERGPLADLMTVFEQLARRLADQGTGVLAGARMTTPASGVSPGAGPPAAAFENYVKGLLAELPASQVRYLEAAIALHADFAAARLALWQAWTSQGEHARALAVLALEAADSPSRSDAAFLAALSEIALQRLDAATARLTALGGPAPPGAVLNNVAVAHLRKTDAGAVQRAACYFSKAAEADPSDADYCFNLGYAYALARDHQAALYWLREVVRRAPADAGAHRVLSLVLGATGATVEAERERELAAQLGEPEAASSRAGGDAVPRGLERLKQTLSGPASPLIDRALTSTGQRDQRDLATFHLDRGRRLVAEQRDREAMAEIGRAVFLVPYEAEAHLLLGRLYLRAGRVRDGIDALKLAVWCQDTAAGRAALAEAYLLARDEAAARAELARAFALDPASPDALAIAARIGRSPLPLALAV